LKPRLVAIWLWHGGCCRRGKGGGGEEGAAYSLHHVPCHCQVVAPGTRFVQ
jgi:hypothetical protein